MTGNEVKRRREALGLSQGDVALMIDPQSNPKWARGTVYRWERYGDRELPHTVGMVLEMCLAPLEKERATA